MYYPLIRPVVRRSTLSDDGTATATLTGGQTVKLFGVSYSTMYINANGNISFSSSDGDTSESLEDHFEQPRISVLFDDLNPASGGTMSWQQLADRVAVTWLDVPEYNETNTNTCQVEMFFDGKIVLSYLSVAAEDGVVGLSRGNGVPVDYYASDLSAMGNCGPKPPKAQSGSTSTAVATPVAITLDATDDGLPDPPAALEYIITTLPAHDLIDAGNDHLIAPGELPYTLTTNGAEVIYVPAAGYAGGDSFRFVANDGDVPPDGGDSNEAVISITVGGPAWSPVAHEVNTATAVNLRMDITLHGADPNADPLTYVIESLPTAGYLNDPAGGPIESVPYALAGGGRVVNYQPPCGVALADTFSYSVHDATAGSNVASVNIDINEYDSRVVYSFPLDSDPGWSMTGEWAFGQPTGGGTHDLDPTSGHTGDNVYGYNLAGDYGRSKPVYTLTTTALDCSNLTDVELRFQRWLGVEQYDEAAVQASANGADWITVWENPADVPVSDQSWQLQTLDLSAVADGEATVMIRWTMGPTDSSVTYPGWNIDDVEIWAIVPIVYSDYNGDGLVDLADYAMFTDCFSGPGADTAWGCLCMDQDADNDVDLADFAEMMLMFGE